MARALWIVGLGVAGLALIVGLSGCAPEPVGVGCPKLTAWSSGDQKALAAAYRAAPVDGVERKAIDDLEFMRDQARACAGVKPPR
jgi:hypothetical protein